MRKSILLMVILSLSASAHAQSTGTEATAPTAASVDRCRRFDSPPDVVVTLRDGQSWRGTLMCLGDEVEVATRGQLSRTPLSEVKQIAEPRDPIWEGPVIGAAAGALIWAVCGGDCDSGEMLRTTAYYTIFGLVMDALISHNKTIYKANLRSPAVALRFRF